MEKTRAEVCLTVDSAVDETIAIRQRSRPTESACARSGGETVCPAGSLRGLACPLASPDRLPAARNMERGHASVTVTVASLLL